jgi:hypothetical protein
MLSVLKSGSLNLPEAAGPVQASARIALPSFTQIYVQIHTGKLHLSVSVDIQRKTGFTSIKFIPIISQDKEATGTLLLLQKSDDRHCQKC